jgi:hypothetical protein
VRNEPWIVDRPQARTASSHAVAIVGRHLCGGVATLAGAFGCYGGAACGARPGVPPPSGTGPQAARPDGGRAEGRGYGGAPRRRLIPKRTIRQ